MKLTKKQVKVLLSMLNGKSPLRKAKIDMYDGRPVLVATNGYCLVAIAFDASNKNLEDIQDYFITYNDLSKWYEGAGSKDYFTEEDIVAMATKSDGGYPDWQSQIRRKLHTEIPLTDISISSAMLLNMDRLAGYDGVDGGLLWQFRGDPHYLKYYSAVATDHNNNFYLVMGRKTDQ